MNAADEEISVWKPRLTSTYNTLIDLYRKSGRLNDTTKVFAEIRRGKTSGAGRVGFGLGQVNKVVGRVELTHIFQFFFFNYKNKSMTTYLERLNKIS